MLRAANTIKRSRDFKLSQKWPIQSCTMQSTIATVYKMWKSISFPSVRNDIMHILCTAISKDNYILYFT